MVFIVRVDNLPWRMLSVRPGSTEFVKGHLCLRVEKGGQARMVEAIGSAPEGKKKEKRVGSRNENGINNLE